MIKKKNIGLVIDTNILRDIIGSSDSSATFDLQLADWIKKIISKADPGPRGKTVTLFTSRQIRAEYHSRIPGLEHGRVRKLLDKKFTMRKIPISHDCKIYLSIRLLPNDMLTSDSKRRLSDRTDEKFYILLKGVSDSQKWSDWAIVFASRDRLTLNEVQDGMRHVGNVWFADSMEELDRIIEC